MFSKFISYLSVTAVAVLAVSFGMFMLDEAKLASNSDQVKLAAGGAESAAAVVARDEHGRQLGRGVWRTRIDAYGDKLTGSFETVTGSKDPWTMRFTAFLLGILFWGLALQWLARSLSVWTSGSSSRPARAPV